MTDDSLTFIPITFKLKALGVVRFARKSNVIDIGFKDGQTVVFDIDPKKVTNTRDNFEKEAETDILVFLKALLIKYLWCCLIHPTTTYNIYFTISSSCCCC